jgi:hypothetical protein
MDTKICNVCGVEKSTTDFYRQYHKKAEKFYTRAGCKLCENARSKKYHDINKQKRSEQHKEWRRREKYGLTSDEYQSMLEQQNHVCAICHQKCTSKPSLAVDHDHVTGKVRGLLCGNCNNGLGRFKDNVEWLSNAIEYLNEH